MGRIAVKDAVRLWISRRTARPMLHPLHLLVSNDADGRPLVTLAADLGPSPEVSLSHTARAASAVAADKPIGIDIEPEDGSRNLVLGDFATMEEIRKMREVADLPDAAWITRLWCAKEAAAKALGTGLRGRPASFEAVLVDKGGHFVVRCGEPPRHLQVTTDHFDGVVLAVASAAGGRPGM
jgi:phosphopantetheinyl transferase